VKHLRCQIPSKSGSYKVPNSKAPLQRPQDGRACSLNPCSPVEGYAKHLSCQIPSKSGYYKVPNSKAPLQRTQDGRDGSLRPCFPVEGYAKHLSCSKYQRPSSTPSGRTSLLSESVFSRRGVREAQSRARFRYTLTFLSAANIIRFKLRVKIV
jgi:hypothetical protein